MESRLLPHSRTSACKSATGGVAQAAGAQLMTMITTEDSVFVALDFEVAKQSYQPDVLVMAAGNLTSNVCSAALGDDGSYVGTNASGQ